MKFHPPFLFQRKFQRRFLSSLSPPTAPSTFPEPPVGETPWNPQVLAPITDESSGIFSLAFYKTCDGIQELFASLHEGIGLPWWASVIAGTMVMRFAMLPSKITSVINSRRMNAATSEFSVRVAPLLQRKFPDKTEYNQQVNR
jgi:membrane protein insertase Oxa1/YidC/SpoIIIJ